VNLQYVAGFVDGEGSIGFSRSRTQLFPRVLVVNTNRDILEDFQKHFGGDIQKLYRAKSNWKQAYSWRICNDKAVKFISRISPYLKLKDKQAILMFCWSALKHGKGHKQDKDAMDLIEAQSRWLNKRGVHADPEPMAIAYSVAGKSKDKKKTKERK